MTLSEHMKDRGVSDKQVAGVLGVSRAYVTQMRLGTRTPTLELAIKICEWSNGAIAPADLLKPKAA